MKIVSTWLSRKPHAWAGMLAAGVTLGLVIGSVLFWQDVGHLSQRMSATARSVFDEHQWWRAWTTLFVHSDAKHLLANSFLFFVLGFFLAGYFGWIAFPLMAFLFGGLANVFVLSKMPADVQLVGASGVVFWMGGAWLALYLFLDRRKKLYQRLLRSLGVTLVLFMPAEAFDPQVSYMAHFTGFFLGILWAVAYYLLNRKRFLRAEAIEFDVLEE